MASLMFNEGQYRIARGELLYLTDTIEVVVMKATYVPNQDDLNTVLAAGELADVEGYDGGYGGAGRRVLAGKTIVKDNANDRVVYDATDPAAWPIATGPTVGGFIIQKKGAADDTTAVPIWFIDVADTPANGAALSLVFAAGGIFYHQQ